VTSIIIDPTITAENQFTRIGKELGRWLFVIFVLALFVSLPIAGYYYRVHTEPDIAYLQDSLRTAYGDNNRAQSAMATQIDWVDDSSYRTGWRDACVEYGQGDAVDCTKWAEEYER
jgi:hypothetical protein